MYQVEDVRQYTKSVLSSSLLLVAAYSAAYFLLPSLFTVPEGHAFAACLVWLMAHIGGFLAAQCRVPALLGMLLMGVLIRNVPGDWLRAYTHDWESHIKSLGLCTILARAGLKIDYSKALHIAPLTTLLLGAVPIFAEGFLDSAVFHWMFGMPFYLAASGGFLLSAISPTVIVTGMLDLQKRGYGATRAIPSIAMASAGIDVVVGIAMHSIFDALSLHQAVASNNEHNSSNGGSSSESAAWMIARGPMSIPLGAAASLVGGCVLGCTRALHSTMHRTLAALAMVTLFIFMYTQYHMVGAGALASIGLTSVASWFWSKGWPRPLSSGPSKKYAKEVDDQLAVFWVYVMQPLLFGTIGTTVDFHHAIKGSTIPKSLVVISLGSLGRVGSAAVAVLMGKLPSREMLFLALAWIPKATVQGALSSSPRDNIQRELDHSGPQYQQWYDWGSDILATAVMAIIVTAPIGLIIINGLGPLLLKKVGSSDNQQTSKQLQLQAHPSIDGTTYTSNDGTLSETHDNDPKAMQQMQQPPGSPLSAPLSPFLIHNGAAAGDYGDMEACASPLAGDARAKQQQQQQPQRAPQAPPALVSAPTAPLVSVSGAVMVSMGSAAIERTEKLSTKRASSFAHSHRRLPSLAHLGALLDLHMTEEPINALHNTKVDVGCQTDAVPAGPVVALGAVGPSPSVPNLEGPAWL